MLLKLVLLRNLVFQLFRCLECTQLSTKYGIQHATKTNATHNNSTVHYVEIHMYMYIRWNKEYIAHSSLRLGNFSISFSFQSTAYFTRTSAESELVDFFNLYLLLYWVFK